MRQLNRVDFGVGLSWLPSNERLQREKTPHEMYLITTRFGKSAHFIVDKYGREGLVVLHDSRLLVWIQTPNFGVMV